MPALRRGAAILLLAVLVLVLVAVQQHRQTLQGGSPMLLVRPEQGPELLPQPSTPAAESASNRTSRRAPPPQRRAPEQAPPMSRVTESKIGTHFHRVVLVVHFNYASYYEGAGFLLAFWKRVFPRVLLFGPATDDPALLEIMRELGIRVDAATHQHKPGELAYVSALEALEELAPELQSGRLEGVLWMHHDNVIVLPNALELPLTRSWSAQRVWIDDTNPSALSRLPFGLPALKAVRRAAATDPAAGELVALMERVGIVGDRFLKAPATADSFYVSASDSSRFLRFGRLLASHKLFLEIAIPTLYAAVIPRPVEYRALTFGHPHRLNVTRYIEVLRDAPRKYVMVHPVKFRFPKNRFALPVISRFFEDN